MPAVTAVAPEVAPKEEMSDVSKPVVGKESATAATSTSGP